MTTFSDKVKAAFITVGGSGYAPFASGTWGSAASLIPAAILWYELPSRLSWEIALVVGILAACVLSVAWGKWAVQFFGKKDPGQFVLDEFAGQWVALIAMPIAFHPEVDFATVSWVVFGQFFLFRLFDVIKPPPARQMEALPDGWGILVDDLFAGAYANIVGQLIWRLTPVAGWLGVSIAA